MSKADLKCTLDNGVLTISGDKKIEGEWTEKDYFRRERAHGTFTRQVALPTDAAGDVTCCYRGAKVGSVHDGGATFVYDGGPASPEWEGAIALDVVFGLSAGRIIHALSTKIKQTGGERGQRVLHSVLVG